MPSRGTPGYDDGGDRHAEPDEVVADDLDDRACDGRVVGRDRVQRDEVEQAWEVGDDAGGRRDLIVGRRSAVTIRGAPRQRCRSRSTCPDRAGREAEHRGTRREIDYRRARRCAAGQRHAVERRHHDDPTAQLNSSPATVKAASTGAADPTTAAAAVLCLAALRRHREDRTSACMRRSSPAMTARQRRGHSTQRGFRPGLLFPVEVGRARGDPTTRACPTAGAIASRTPTISSSEARPRPPAPPCSAATPSRRRSAASRAGSAPGS